MNRTGLCIALAIAAVAGVTFGVRAQFDIAIERWFFDSRMVSFPIGGAPWEQHAREVARWLITAIAALAGLAICGKLFLPYRRMMIGGRAALFMLLTLAIGPGLVTNTVLKDHWGRARPIDVTEFGGSYRFTPWWDPRGPCPNNCSFIAGEPSGAFWTLAPAAVTPPQWRVFAYTAALGFGAALGLLRMAAGGHFFTDVVFAGVVTYLIVLAIYRLIVRRQSGEDALENALGHAGITARNGLVALARWIGVRRAK